MKSARRSLPQTLPIPSMRAAAGREPDPEHGSYIWRSSGVSAEPRVWLTESVVERAMFIMARDVVAYI